MPLSIGVEVADGLFYPILRRNSTIPVRRTVPLRSSVRRTDIAVLMEVNLYEGEMPRATDNNLLGTISASAQNEASLTLDVDANGILHVTLESPFDKRSITISNDAGRLSRDDIERMVNLSAQCAMNVYQFNPTGGTPPAIIGPSVSYSATISGLAFGTTAEFVKSSLVGVIDCSMHRSSGSAMLKFDSVFNLMRSFGKSGMHGWTLEFGEGVDSIKCRSLISSMRMCGTCNVHGWAEEVREVFDLPSHVRALVGLCEVSSNVNLEAFDYTLGLPPGFIAATMNMRGLNSLTVEQQKEVMCELAACVWDAILRALGIDTEFCVPPALALLGYISSTDLVRDILQSDDFTDVLDAPPRHCQLPADFSTDFNQEGGMSVDDVYLGRTRSVAKQVVSSMPDID